MTVNLLLGVQISRLRQNVQDKVGELKAGARVSQDEYAKEEAQDFALWKAWS